MVTGLHLLRQSAAKGWIVRHELSIDLLSSRYAHQQYEVDVDLDEVKERLPPILSADRASKIWLPILRIPSLRPADQRIRSALGSDGRVLPLMPQGEVRRYFANAITWLILNDAPPDIQHRSSADHALIRNELRRRLRTYIRTGDPTLVEGLGERLGIPSALWARLPALVNPERPASLGEYWAGIAEALTYCRYGFFVVVGVAADETAAHISCELLPPELIVKKYHRFATAQEVVGFGAGDDGRRRRWWLWPFRSPRVAFSMMTTPARYHLRIPVPELGDLDAVHVQLRVPEDVCAEPAVLHHDQRIFTDERRLAMQSRCRGRRLTPSPLEVLRRDVRTPGALPTADAGRLVARELDGIAIEWEFRAGRLDTVERLTDTSPRSSPGRKLAGAAWRALVWVRSGFGRNGLDPYGRLANTDLRQRALSISDLARKLAGEIRTRADALDRDPDQRRANGMEDLREHAFAGLDYMREIERSVPHVELTADDDRREHVIHFHVDSTRTVHQRTTDSRPVINAIVRPSRLGRNDFVGTASLSCLTSTVLLLGLFVLVEFWPGRRPNAEALVALLLLVPGLSVSLLGRVPGETMRQLVLGRAQRLASLSLIPPVVSAAVIAAVFGNQPSPVESEFELPFGLPLLTMSTFLAVAGLVSGVITLMVVRDRFRGFGTFGMRSRVLGLITYRAEDEGGRPSDRDPLAHYGAARGRPDHDEATEATTNIDRIVQLTEPALFQITRPSQRFMVWVVQNEDEPDVFRQVIDVLENLPRHLTLSATGHPSTAANVAGRTVRQMVRGMMRSDDLEPSRTTRRDRRDPTIVESSLVMSVASTGVTMSIVSHDLASGARGLIEEQEIATIIRRELHDPGRTLTVVVDEIDDDTRYFRYRALGYEHFSFVGQDDKTRRRDLINRLLKLENKRRRISYLYCPIQAKPGDPDVDGSKDRAAIRVGFAVVRDEPESDDHLRLRLTSAAAGAGYAMTSSRSVADGAGAGLGYHWDGGGDGSAPHMLLSAGPDDGGGLAEALDVLGPSDSVLFEGGTVLTDGGYTCRTLRFWADDDALDDVRNRLPAAGTRSGDDPTHWRILPSATDDPLVGGSTWSEPRWLISWVRWRLELGTSTGVAYLLSVMDEWVAATRTQRDWSVTYSNIEFLANRLHDRRLVSGKARYRLGIRVAPGHRVEDYAEEINRSLETFLRAGIDPLLTNRRRYIVVDGVEPQNPLTVSVDSF